MTDDHDSQIEIPQSFLALFTAPGRARPSAPRAEVAARYELCEDLATLLTTTAADMQFSLGIAESDVLQRVHQGLLGEAAVVTPVEAWWVMCRLAELSNWEQPGQVS